MSNDALIDQIACGDTFVAWAAAERYAENPRSEDVPRLAAAYDACPAEDIGLRMEIVDLIGLFDSPESHSFLKRMAHARAHIWVRYSAMRNLLADVEFRPEGAAVTVRRSKTDQEGKGQRKAIPFGKDKRTCPVKALWEWIKAASIEEGSIFRRVDRWDTVSHMRPSPQSVALVVKDRAHLLGLDPDAIGGSRHHAPDRPQVAGGARRLLPGGEPLPGEHHREDRIIS